MKKITVRLVSGLFVLFLLTAAHFSSDVYASHAWGNYHWARTSNPFVLKLGDNVSSVWDPFLTEASNDWSASPVLDTTVVRGSTRSRFCRAQNGRIEVCNYRYGNNGWLGLAQIWVTGDHITKALAKMNDTYFSKSAYNTPAWKRLVMCQEIAHGFGLDHQDEAFDNGNLGTCMDYTADPDGPPSNEHPNAHDFDMLAQIYAHADGSTTLSQSILGRGMQNPFVMPPLPLIDLENISLEDPSQWGQKVRESARMGLFERDLGFGSKVHTFVIYADESR